MSLYDDEELDEFITSLSRQIEVEDNKTSIINLFKVKEILELTDRFKSYFGAGGVKVTCKICEPFKSLGSISLTGKNISFNNSDIFIDAFTLSDNFDVYPKTNGDIQIDFAFHELICRIGDV